ncbi:ficolin-1 [Plakobranchus ocellatus]|uniref:Ficolin-1 n=1 Tax=Plakobranchus ocellatus TaxID=259542 RepID=A0AAV4CG17_9GAST|nr:ficolin-1 [Plakobranchus ocellatus]
MDRSCLFMLCCISVLVNCQGLNLTLNRDVNFLSGSRSVCGILRCAETYHGSTNSSSASRNISRMSIYQRTQALIGSDDGSNPGKLLASLTFPRPNVSYKADGVNAKGTLTARSAVIEIELDPHHHCFSDYTCEVHTTVVNQGTDIISSSTLVHVPEQRASLGSEGRITQSMMQILSLVQQLDTKWSDVIADKVRPLESQNEALQNRVSSLERELYSRVNVLENKEAERRKLETHESSNMDKVFFVVNRIEEKIENHISDKLHDLDSKFSLLNTDAIRSVEQRCTAIDASVKNVQSTLALIQEKLQANTNEAWVDNVQSSLALIQEKLQAISGTLAGTGPIDVTINSTSHAQKLCTFLQNQILTNNRKQETLWKNLTKKVDKMATTNHALVNEVSRSFVLMQEKLQYNTNQTEASVSRSFAGGLFSMNNILSPKQAVPIREVEEENLFMYRTCERGITLENSNNLLNFYSYAIIFPEDNDVITSPYLCDTVTDGGGWIVIQRRKLGDVDFIQNWAAYKNGFGSLFGDFWLGNDNIHAITSSGTYELKVDLKYEGKSVYAWYSNFSIDSEENKYTLRLGDYIAGGAGDSLSYHRDMPFSTIDMDNDKDSGGNCAFACSGAWWYNDCTESNLNGLWKGAGKSGMLWYRVSSYYSLQTSEIKIRPRAERQDS